MPMHTSDTRLSHLDCLMKLGWLSFDATHMGEPDGYLLTPCCIHGFRGVYSPRSKLDWTRVVAGDHGGAEAYMNRWTDPVRKDSVGLECFRDSSMSNRRSSIVDYRSSVISCCSSFIEYRSSMFDFRSSILIVAHGYLTVAQQ